MLQTITDEERLALDKLSDYKLLIDEDIKQYSASLVEDWQTRYGQYSRDGIQAYVELLDRGGKRLRGALMMNTYEMLGGEDQALAVRVARIVEMMHAYILIIDDIQDQSEVRRGGLTAHKLLEVYHREQKMHGDSAHFGISQALNAAISGAHTAMAELADLPIDPAIRAKLLQQLNASFITTGVGQFNDIFNEAIQDVTEDQVKRVLTWKTAYYSFWNPIVMGALLAGRDVHDVARLEEYSTHAGLSFQITDDILGTFGDSFESGKSAMDDIREGKVTVLIAKTLARASQEQKRHVLSALGNHDLSTDDYVHVKGVIEETGALDYAQQMAKSSATKAVASLDAVPEDWQRTNVLFLRGLAKYITSRKG